MSYLKKYQWEISPDKLPVVRRNCPKCNQKTNYINTEKFRVNANKNSIDVWLIHQCEKCKSTWNMTIYERINPVDINNQEYGKFLTNDKELVKKYAFDLRIYNKNKAEVILEDVNYEVNQKELEAFYINKNELVIEIICRYPIELRVDTLLSNKLRISRSKIKKLHERGIIFINDENNSLNKRVRNKMEIHVLNIVENIEIIESIVQVV
ncbi:MULTISPECIES: DUF1062 domain-containing protein [unclassified Clostridium]|uniref:DUF1062 domain-containing protein n=1 Tax=unclassified Clostridium TaxID=2614128 RepID=UPI0002985715|nr:MULTISPECIES: DUF1062 domain-containing protein [unclassified Clostridium]EKQ56811.1 MAG: hypothetical protein A370_01586 [Clostridium sp. Maddingley MBC34-26]